MVASSGFVTDPQDWSLLPNASLLSIGIDGHQQNIPVRPGQPICPIKSPAVAQI